MHLEPVELSQHRSRRPGVRDPSNMAPNPPTRDAQPTVTDLDQKIFAALRRKNPPGYVPFSLLRLSAHTSWIVAFLVPNECESGLTE
jgi:hypothetical protein